MCVYVLCAHTVYELAHTTVLIIFMYACRFTSALEGALYSTMIFHHLPTAPADTTA